MSVFQPGWYQVQRKLDGSFDYRYFNTSRTYIAHCLVEANGAQKLWWDARSNPPARTMNWNPGFERGSDSLSTATWDAYARTVGNPEMEPPPSYSRLDRQLTCMEEIARSAESDFTGLDCVQEIHVGIFFDGTNNNMERDKPNGHSNIVSLYDAHAKDSKTNFAYYIPGVGTPFKEIGEKTESSSGKTFARGGEARINWAMLQVYNAVCSSLTGFDLIQKKEMRKLVTQDLSTYFSHTVERLGVPGVFQGINQRLNKEIKSKRPRITQLNISVFGFSRGAAQARVFCNWIRQVSDGLIGDAKLNLRFLGLFDTVASVGLADSSPVGRGFLHWAHNNLDISKCKIKKTVHYVAGHEIRRSFPLSTVRNGSEWPANTREFVYPGTHSDIGGGYSPGDQGKSLGGRSSLMSQITLNDMYQQAFSGGVRLIHREQMSYEMVNDFAIDKAMHDAFMAYTAWTHEINEQKENLADSRRGEVESRMHTQMQYYWRWRSSKRTEAQFKAMHSWENARPQDKQDLWESELDWRVDVVQAKKAHEPMEGARYMPGVGTTRQPKPGNPSRTQIDLVRIVNIETPIPPLVDAFFDRYVHDSHAGFLLLGPLTQWDKQVFVNEIRSKKNQYDAMIALSRIDAMNAHVHIRSAERYALNRFEQRVYNANNPKANSGAAPVIPVMTDDDAADLRKNMGMGGTVVKLGMGSGTRREANGAGQYRRVFDHDNEIVAVADELGRLGAAAVENIQDRVDKVGDGIDAIKDQALDSVTNLPGRAADSAVKRAKDSVRQLIPKNLPPLR